MERGNKKEKKICHANNFALTLNQLKIHRLSIILQTVMLSNMSTCKLRILTDYIGSVFLVIQNVSIYIFFFFFFKYLNKIWRALWKIITVMKLNLYGFIYTIFVFIYY